MEHKGRIKRNSIRPTSQTTNISSASSLLDSVLQDCQQQPSSPTSSSTSQATGDRSFEPSVDMMVNDFDDEQTLTEEEALAQQEGHDPTDEIETLQKESEMPLEKLLAHYKQSCPIDYTQKKYKQKKAIRKRKWLSQKSKEKSARREVSTSNSASIQHLKNTATVTQNEIAVPVCDEVIVIEESDDEVEILKTEEGDTDVGEDDSIQDTEQKVNGDEEEATYEGKIEFDNSSYENDLEHTHNSATDCTKLTALALLYPEKYANLQYLSEEEYDDEDYVKRTIMVGDVYQAIIPNGLSKYGDILPYENEDTLIWEPCQVSEIEVENYLIRVKEFKLSANNLPQEENLPSLSCSVKFSAESDLGNGRRTVKDDEQALHLLVQCGYNFEKALHQKRINAVPLTESMGVWSEEECCNFENGIKKFGKSFRKIQQTQVRTRSIAELVLFYYLWKKKKHHGQEYIDSDTIDHMDAYLDFDERETASNASSSCDTSFVNDDTRSKKHHHFSIMNKTKCSPATKKASTSKKSYRQRRQSSQQSRINKSTLKS